MKNNSQKGYTLIEMILVAGLLISATLLTLFQKASDLEQDRAKALGIQLFQYNNAIRAWVSSNPQAPDATHFGTTWLKPTSCGGSSSIEYLPCSFPDATVSNPITFGKLTLTTTVRRITAGGKTNLRATTTSTAMLVGSDTRADLSGLAIITAAAGSGFANNPVMMATESSFKSDPTSSIMTMTAGNSANNDAWLRTDGSNTMNSNITFNSASTPAGRQVNNVSRISGIGTEALYLGLSGGSLAGNTIVLDGDQNVLGRQIATNNRNLATAIQAVRGDIVASAGNVRASGAVIAGKNVSAGGSVTAGGNISATGSVSAGSNISTSGAVTASTNITANGSLTGQVFFDANNKSYYVDPHSTSNLNTLNAARVTSSGRMKVGEFIELVGIAIEGARCSPNGLLGRNSAGLPLSCQSGYWKGTGVQLGAIWSKRNYPGQGWIPMDCPDGYVMTGMTAPMEDHKIIRCRQLL